MYTFADSLYTLVDIDVYEDRQFVYDRRHSQKRNASTFVDAGKDENAPGWTRPGGENRLDSGARSIQVYTLS